MGRIVETAVRAFAESKYTLPLLFFAGAAIRLWWGLQRHHLKPYTSEMHQVAVTLAKTGAIANAYRIDGMPTTHVGPIAPVPGALVYYLFGPDSRTSELLLTFVAVGVVLAICLVFDRVFAWLGESRLSRRLAIAIFLLFPIYIETEVRDFRIREGGYATLILGGLLIWLLRLDKADRIRWRDMFGVSVVMAFLFLLSPANAVPGYAACAVLTIRRLPPLQWPKVAITALGVLLLMSFPWALRNKYAVGEMVWSRGNVGLEMSDGTFPGAVDPKDPAKAFSGRLDAVHPYKGDVGYNRMIAAGGEVKYSKQQGDEMWAWIRANRGDALRIWVRHVREYYLPPRWLWSPYGTPMKFKNFRKNETYALTIVGLVSIGIFLARRRWLYAYPFVMIATAVIPFIIVQPRTRYRYTIAILLLFTATAGLTRMVAWLRHRRRGASTPDDPHAALPAGASSSM